MIPVANTKQMRECDRVTIEEHGLSGVILMENASRAVVESAIDMLQNGVILARVIVICGKGNNGGDGFVVARYLYNAGAEISVYLLGETLKLTGDAKLNCQLFQRLGGIVSDVKLETDLPPADQFCELVVDGLLGTGFQGEPRGLYTAAIARIKEIKAPVIAIDIPSGVDANTGQTAGVSVKADRTVTFGLLKRGLMFSPGRELAGDVVVADIGIPPQVVIDRKINCHLTEAEDVRRVIPQRHPAMHKGDVGHVYLIAASPGMTGAATLSAQAVMRVGPGLTIVGVPASLNGIMELKLTEPMTQGLPETSDGFLGIDALPLIMKQIEWADVFAFGPGLGRHPETAQILTSILKKIAIPMVIDADGLFMLSKERKLLNNLPTGCILTPHAGEFIRLADIKLSDLNEDRARIAAEFAVIWKTIVVLKGAPTVTAAPDGSTYLNSTGNPGMATGGSGDVLTGIIAGLIAQGSDPLTAAWSGSYIMGKAGDRAAMDKGQHGLIAGDIVDNIAYAMREIIEA